MTKRTIQNCRLVKKAVRIGIGSPEIEGDMCLGYAGDCGDEPCDTCKKCKLNTTYE